MRVSVPCHAHTHSAAHTERERTGTLSTFSTFFTFPFEGLNLSPHYTHSNSRTHTHTQTTNVFHHWEVIVNGKCMLCLCHQLWRTVSGPVQRQSLSKLWMSVRLLTCTFSLLPLFSPEVCGELQRQTWRSISWWWWELEAWVRVHSPSSSSRTTLWMNMTPP